MKNNRKILLGVLISVVVLIMVAGFVGTQMAINEGNKEFTLEVVSERDSFDEAEEYESDLDSLGEFLRTQDYVIYQESDYGIYITGVKEMNDDMNEQYWWCLSVDGVVSSVGADDLMLEDDAVYKLELVQGW